ncbi:hypothetical protein GCM10022261_18130 [Brevibacterium daeguense]|uniref:Non-homologous end joining protein Ku n=1 Tax=Brevibacterium daeguense TaxID=909936 RepID=A0ABP8EK06_9MICO|nr:Ku protein [Brevibacterium daeguense]
MRAIWSGTVAFGLVSVPVKLYSATKDHDISLHQVHDADGGRIRYKRQCEVCGQQVDYEHIDKAYEDGEDTIILTDEELKALPASEDKEIEVVQFVPDEQIDPMAFEKSYFLEPSSKSAKAYILLRRTLEETERTAIVKFALRSKTRLAALRVRDDVIVLQTMLWADELREAEFESTSADVNISDRELTMSRALVEQFSDDYEPEKFVDDYQEQLRILIQEKIEHGEAIDTEATFGRVPEEDADTGGDVIDLMEALKRSVDAKRQEAKEGSGRGRSSSAPEDSDAEAEKPPSKRRASRRTADDEDAQADAASSVKSTDESDDEKDEESTAKQKSSPRRSTGRSTKSSTKSGTGGARSGSRSGSRSTAASKSSESKSSESKPAASKSRSTKAPAAKSGGTKSTSKSAKSASSKSASEGTGRKSRSSRKSA